MASPSLFGHASITDAGARQADSGRPPPRPFPRQTMSGSSPTSGEASTAPHRPRPVRISSAMTRTPASRARALTSAMYPSGGTLAPPRAWTGSTMSAPIGSPFGAPSRKIRRTTASDDSAAPAPSRTKSGKGANPTPPYVRASNGARKCARSVTESAPSVSPWYPPSKARMPARPEARPAVLRADSHASDPVDESTTRAFGHGARRTSRSSRSTLATGGCTSPIPCTSRLLWRSIASRATGLECPSSETAKAPVRST